MKIRIYSITKKQNLHNEFIEKIRQFGVNMETIDIFNSTIQKAQKNSPIAAQISYGNEFEKYIKKDCLNISLHPKGEEIDTHQFVQILKDRNEINFFIGGAFGFEEKFLSKTKNISLSKLTFSHKIAKTVLFEQTFRALCIINNHPYHK